MDQREYVVDWEETIRTAFAGLMAGQWHAMPGRLTEDSPDGHNSTVQITIKRMVTDAETGARSYESHPVHPDVIVHFPGGAGTVLTHGLAKGDEGLIVYANRDVDSWRQSGGEQQPVTNRMAGYQDPHLIPGIRSDPRKLQQVAPDAMHARDEQKHAVHEVKPGAGVSSFHADPSTPSASPTFDPLASASKFLRHVVQSAQGIVGRAVDGGTEHSHGVDHDQGAWMSALNGQSLVRAHPAIGALMSALGGAHIVHADPNAGVTVSSAKAVQISSQGPLSISAPPGMMSLSGLARGGISGGAIQAGGDISGTLDQAKVVSLANVDGRTLPAAGSDSAAAAAGVPLGGLYRNTAVAAGVSLLAVRMA